MSPSLVTNDLGLWWSAVTATVAGALCLWGARRGVAAHRVPRVGVAVSVAVIAVTYWADILVAVPTPWTAEWRRGAGWVLWPCLAWTAWSGVVYSRRIVAATEKLVGDGDVD